jgi:hypothetical protein
MLHHQTPIHSTTLDPPIFLFIQLNSPGIHVNHSSVFPLLSPYVSQMPALTGICPLQWIEHVYWHDNTKSVKEQSVAEGWPTNQSVFALSFGIYLQLICTFSSMLWSTDGTLCSYRYNTCYTNLMSQSSDHLLLGPHHTPQCVIARLFEMCDSSPYLN